MRKLMLWGAAVAISVGSTASHANVVVVKSIGPSSKSYPPGKMLPESAKISLQGGDVVTVIGPSSAQTLRGPGNFDAKQVALASAASQRGRFGALRASEVAHNPSIWDIDVSSGGRVCVAETAKPQVWRADSEGPISVQIRSANGESQTLSWASGKALTPWPTALPIKSGAEYSVEWPDGGESSKLDVVAISSPPTDLVGAAQILLENGCQKQLDLLVESASKADK
ncbi:MAG: hypothetical protein ACJ8EH_07925 [Sphingomicrobium sp.]